MNNTQFYHLMLKYAFQSPNLNNFQRLLLFSLLCATVGLSQLQQITSLTFYQFSDYSKYINMVCVITTPITGRQIVLSAECFVQVVDLGAVLMIKGVCWPEVQDGQAGADSPKVKVVRPKPVVGRLNGFIHGMVELSKARLAIRQMRQRCLPMWTTTTETCTDSAVAAIFG